MIKRTGENCFPGNVVAKHGLNEKGIPKIAYFDSDKGEPISARKSKKLDMWIVKYRRPTKGESDETA